MTPNIFEVIEYNIYDIIYRKVSKSEANIDWNFVLGLIFGIGYLIFKELKGC